MSDSLVLPIAGSLPLSLPPSTISYKQGLFFHSTGWKGWQRPLLVRLEMREGNPKMAEDDLELRDVAGLASIF